MANKKKKKLMILIWNMGIGGVQKRVRDLILGIAKDYPHWEVHLLIKTKTPNYFTTEITDHPRVKIYYFSLYKKRFSSLPFLFWTTKHFLMIKPEVCLTFLDYLSIIMIAIRQLFFWKKTKLVLNEGILTSRYLQIHRNFFWKFLVKLTYKYADKIIVPTKSCQKDLISNFNVSPKKIVVVPNWTLFNPYQPQKPIFDLIYIGRFEKEKGVLSLISIVKKLKKNKPDISLCLIGEGAQLSSIKKQIKRNSLAGHVKIKGHQKNVIPYLRKSKIFILNSRSEGMPNVALEAAMCQVPTISKNFPGCNEVIRHGKTGYIAMNKIQLIELTVKLLCNHQLRRKTGRQAQLFVQGNFSFSNQKKFIQTLLS